MSVSYRRKKGEVVVGIFEKELPSRGNFAPASLVVCCVDDGTGKASGNFPATHGVVVPQEGIAAERLRIAAFCSLIERVLAVYPRQKMRIEIEGDPFWVQTKPNLAERLRGLVPASRIEFMAGLSSCVPATDAARLHYEGLRERYAEVGHLIYTS